MDEVGLPLVEGAGDDPERLIRGRREADFLALLAEMVGGDDILLRADGGARRVVEVEPISVAADTLVQSVVSVGIIGVIVNPERRTIHVGAGIGHVEIVDLALDGQRRLPEAVA